VCHMEYLTDIYSSVDFLNRSYPINPGDTVTFPWLSQVARNYQQYKIHGMVFIFRSTSASWNGSDQALGTIIASTQYDVLADPFSSKIEAENYEFSDSVAPNADVEHPIECSMAESPLTELYIRSEEIDDEKYDRRFHDFGEFQLCTVGMSTSGVNLGELHVIYDIELLKPKLTPGVNLPGAYWQLRDVGFGTVLSPCDLVSPVYQGSLPITATNPSSTSFRLTFNQNMAGGRYSIAYTMRVSSSVSINSMTYTYSALTLVSGMTVDVDDVDESTVPAFAITTTFFTNLVVDYDGGGVGYFELSGGPPLNVGQNAIVLVRVAKMLVS